jgi:hypothetical protein
MSDPVWQEDPSGRSLASLAAAITSGAVRLAAATAAWLRLVAEFDERGGWHGYGIASCAHWLAWQCGLSPGSAREHVRAARALRSLPLIEAAFAEGRLRSSKDRALTRIADRDCEESLLEAALEMTAAQVETIVRHWRRANDPDRDRRFDRKESFGHWWDDDGMLTVKIRLSPEHGAAFLTSIESIAERDARRERAQEKKSRATTAATEPEDDDPTGTDRIRRARERAETRRVAAVAALAEAAADAGRRAGDPPRREVVVHVDAAVLADDAAAGQAYLEGGPAITPAQARRMLCEATVVTMLEQGREPLAVGRRKRRATRAQRRALLRRDGGCARPGCTETRIERLHAHHMQHWYFGGTTDIANLVLLCDRDHGLVHDLDLVLARRDGVLVVTTRDGRRVWGAADAAFADGLDGLADLDDSWMPGDAFAGVHPVDTVVGRRPAAPLPRRARGPVGRSDQVTTRPPTARPGRRSTTRLLRHRATTDAVPIGATLFPGGEPTLPDAMHVNGERMDVRYVVGVLMDNRDLVRRLAAEQERERVR